VLWQYETVRTTFVYLILSKGSVNTSHSTLPNLIDLLLIELELLNDVIKKMLLLQFDNLLM
jgi:hypothetical protein